MDRIERRKRLEQIEKEVKEITVFEHGQGRRAQMALEKIVDLLKEDEYFFQALVEED